MWFYGVLVVVFIIGKLSRACGGEDMWCGGGRGERVRVDSG